MTSLKKLGPFYTHDQWVWDRLITEPGGDGQPDTLGFVMGYLGHAGVRFEGLIDGPMRAGAMGDLRRKLLNVRQRQISYGVAAMENFEIAGWEMFSGPMILVRFIKSRMGSDAGQILYVEIAAGNTDVCRRIFASDSEQWPPDELVAQITDKAMEVAAESSAISGDVEPVVAKVKLKDLLHPITRQAVAVAASGPAASSQEVEGQLQELPPRTSVPECQRADPSGWHSIQTELVVQFCVAVGNDLTADALLSLPELTEDFIHRFLAVRGQLDTPTPDASELFEAAMHPYFDGEQGRLSGHAVVLMKTILGLFATEELAKAWIETLDKALLAHALGVDAKADTRTAREVFAMVMQPFFKDGTLPGHMLVLMRAIMALFATEELALVWAEGLDEAMIEYAEVVDSNLTTMADDKGAVPPR